MTIITILSRKPDNVPLVKENECNEAKVELPIAVETADEDHPAFVHPKSRPGIGSILCLSLISFVGLILGLMAGMSLYRSYPRPSMQRYYGSCAVPFDLGTDNQRIEAQFHVMVADPDSDAETFPFKNFLSGGNNGIVLNDDDFLNDERDPFNNVQSINNFLNEVFAVTQNAEIFKAKGPDGKATKVLHDFTANVSGIIDDERCFVMPLDRDTTLQPMIFIRTIQEQNSEDIDLTPIYSMMQALLPPLSNLDGLGSHIGRSCGNVPTYNLVKNRAVIRKRSADTPNAQYSHFSGKHIKEIDISNLQEIINNEKKTE